MHSWVRQAPAEAGAARLDITGCATYHRSLKEKQLLGAPAVPSSATCEATGQQGRGS